MKRRTLLQATAASATLLAAPMIKAQTLPSGPIRIVVGFPPGGGTDALARVLAQKLQAHLACSKCGNQGQVIAIAQVSNAEHLAFNFAKTRTQ